MAEQAILVNQRSGVKPKMKECLGSCQTEGLRIVVKGERGIEAQRSAGA